MSEQAWSSWYRCGSVRMRATLHVGEAWGKPYHVVWVEAYTARESVREYGNSERWHVRPWIQATVDCSSGSVNYDCSADATVWHDDLEAFARATLAVYWVASRVFQDLAVLGLPGEPLELDDEANEETRAIVAARALATL